MLLEFMFQLVIDHDILINPTTSYKSASVLDCASLCRYPCFSFFFNLDQQQCALANQLHDDKNPDIQSIAGWKYYSNSVDPHLHNIAVDKPATSSTVWRKGFGEIFGPERAVDGNMATNWLTGSCFAVKYGDPDPWWQVDLENTFLVSEIRVTARGDCCPERLRDFELRVYDENPSVVSSPKSRLCNKYVGKVTVPGAIVTLTCDFPVTGRYVRVVGDTPTEYQDI